MLTAMLVEVPMRQASKHTQASRPARSFSTLVCILSLCAIGEVRGQQGDSQSATAHPQGRPPETDYGSLTKAAEAGDTEAQYKLAVALAGGSGVPKSPSEALKWFTRAAEQGHAKAQHSLGCLYLVGDDGVPKDPVQGLMWHRRAAEQGNPIMQWGLAGVYQGGFGIPKDLKESARWMRYAAEQGFSLAQTSLGVMYNGGEGVPQDFVLAYFWMNLGVTCDNRWTIDGERPLGAERIEVDAKSAAAMDKLRGFNSALRDSLAALMTPAQIAEAQRLTREFKPKKWDVLNKQPINNGELDADVCGSGFFIAPDGFFVTNHHVVADARRVRVKTVAGIYPAKVVCQDQANDLALLKVEGTFAALHITGSAAVRSGDRVFTVGYPNPTMQGVLPKYSGGDVAALTGPGDDPRFLQVSLPVQPGNSGGPLVDAQGGVVGVVVGQLDKSAALKASGQLPENVNYAVKGSFVLTLLEAVPGLNEKIRAVPLPEASGTPLVKTVESATGMVLVDR